MELVKPSVASRELGVVPQNVYGWLWAGLLPGKQNPETGAWIIKRSDLEEFKKHRKRREPKLKRTPILAEK